MLKKILTILVAAAMLATYTGCSGKNEQDSSSANESEATTSDATSSLTSSEATSSDSQNSSDNNASEPEEAVWNPDVPVRQQISDGGYSCGAILIGYVDGAATFEQCRELLCDGRYAAELGDLSDMPETNFVDTAYGCELYLVIPCCDDVCISVSEWLMTEENDYMGAKGDVLYHNDYGAPVLIKCNVSDIMPSTIITIEHDEETLQWSPSISLKDGSMSRIDNENKIDDLTHYIYNETWESYTIGEAVG